MRKLTYTLSGLLCGLIMAAPQAGSMIKPAINPAIIIEYQNDYCSVDNIGLVRLTIEDIERIVE